MTLDECRVETQKHIDKVRKYIRFFTDKLTTRGENHDASKLDTPEIELFAEHTDRLNEIEYGSDELKNDEEVFFTALDTVVFREYQDMIDILDQIIRGAGEKIRNDRNIMNKVMEEYDLRRHKEYMYDCYARYAGDLLKQNPDFILDTFEKYPNLIAFERTKDSFQDDKYYTIFDKEASKKGNIISNCCSHNSKNHKQYYCNY